MNDPMRLRHAVSCVAAVALAGCGASASTSSSPATGALRPSSQTTTTAAAAAAGSAQPVTGRSQPTGTSLADLRQATATEFNAELDAYEASPGSLRQAVDIKLLLAMRSATCPPRPFAQGVIDVAKTRAAFSQLRRQLKTPREQRAIRDYLRPIVAAQVQASLSSPTQGEASYASNTINPWIVEGGRWHDRGCGGLNVGFR